MSVDHHAIYQNQARMYEALVAREDYQGNIWRALQKICSWQDKTVCDLGAGTGRLIEIILPHAKYVWGFDHSPGMLGVAREKLHNGRFANWALAAAEHEHIPLAQNKIDCVISGWSLVYLALDQNHQWRETAAEAFERIQQLLLPDGKFIILETMGTGFTEPNPPQDLLPYFTFLQDIGFQSTWIRTDYKFSTVEEAVSLTQFFFGAELAAGVLEKQSTILPECTGIWWK